MAKYRIYAKKTTWAYKDIDVDNKQQAESIADEMHTLEGFTDIQSKMDEHSNSFNISSDDIEQLPSKWAEIRCDYYNDIDNYWCVDAWTDINIFSDSEEVVIAKIFDNGYVEYLDEDAKSDDYAQEMINNKIKELDEEMER